MTECPKELGLDFYPGRALVVKFSALELSADAGILLARQAEERLQVCEGMADCIDDWRDPNKIVHSLPQLNSQRVYQLVGSYEDANDSNHLRHDPICKLACGRVSKAGDNLLASQPTITRLENRVDKTSISPISLSRNTLVNGQGRVRLHGVYWSAKVEKACRQPLDIGTAVTVLRREGLTLLVQLAWNVKQY